MWLSVPIGWVCQLSVAHYVRRALQIMCAGGKGMYVSLYEPYVHLPGDPSFLDKKYKMCSDCWPITPGDETRSCP